MPTMTKLIAILAMTTGFGLAACKPDPDKTKETAPVAKPTESTAKPQDKPAEVKPTEETKPTPTAAADLPAECAEYKGSDREDPDV